ncbi:MAG: flagellar hook-basal body complex protein FliE [Rhodospirillales bacterium]|nr:flagellar hook-basal body complex protein FliE [Rhodospirillales bacterium]MDE1883123.1 flagellar hook-basal body complex protein FliE [Rhodospirillales bacterium]MDE2391782.1 flagellar hook-basal body complex protein FliE [Rhodospirillales bacterium]MDE2458782.1 flagellar hook-basal body complex protein FliE [Rhodospirillales bacterium]
MISNIAAQTALSTASGLTGGSASSASAQPGHFLSLISDALQGVSAQQASAASAEAGYAAGVPGATLGKALVASDRAEVAWNATVAVRNEVVSAYQAVMNMQF